MDQDESPIRQAHSRWVWRRGPLGWLFRRFVTRADIVVLPRHRAVYLSVPKVACSSLKECCAELIRPAVDLSGSAQARPFYDLKARRLLRRQGILISKRDLARYGDYWKFCFVRNPWDRLVSCYCNKIGDRQTGSSRARMAKSLRGVPGFHPGMSFEAFVTEVCAMPDSTSDIHFRSQHTFVADTNGRLLVDHVAYYEDLQREFARVLEKIGAVGVELPHRKKSKRRPLQDYYTGSLIEKVGRRYDEDVRLFGYAYDGRTEPTPPVPRTTHRDGRGSSEARH